MWLFLAFLAVPIIEIALFIQIGGVLGLWPTLGIVILTAIAGTWLVRTQGALALNDLRKSFSSQTDPTETLAHGAMILVAGVLLLTPGFFTDALGFSLLMPPFRRAAFQYLRKKVQVQSFGFSGQTYQAQEGGKSVIEGEFEDISTDKPKSDPPSGWSGH